MAPTRVSRSRAAAICAAAALAVLLSHMPGQGAFVTGMNMGARTLGSRVALPAEEQAPASESVARVKVDDSSMATTAGLLGLTGLLVGGAAARTSRRGARKVQVIARRAEEGSFFERVGEQDAEEKADKEEAEQRAAEDPEFDNEAGTEEAGEKEIQEKVEVYPSKQYVNYIARHNAYRTWSGQGKLQVDIALLTERIRNLVLTCQEHPHDYLARDTLVKIVARRRRLLDRLSWEDLDSYLNMRETLKIRHNFRVEALIGRAKEYKYTVENRPTAPGRKTTMRLKKTRRLLENRLARQLKQGRPRKIVSTTRKKLFGRRFVKMANDEAKDYVGRRDPNVNNLMDPIDMYEQKKWGAK